MGRVEGVEESSPCSRLPKVTAEEKRLTPGLVLDYARLTLTAMNLDQAATFLRISRPTLERWIRQGLLADAGLRGEGIDRELLGAWARRHGMAVGGRDTAQPSTPTDFFADALRRGAVTTDGEARNAKSAIESALHALDLPGEVHESLLEETLGRERLATTALGHGVAIPHPRKPRGERAKPEPKKKKSHWERWTGEGAKPKREMETAPKLLRKAAFGLTLGCLLPWGGLAPESVWYGNVGEKLLVLLGLYIWHQSHLLRDGVKVPGFISKLGAKSFIGLFVFAGLMLVIGSCRSSPCPALMRKT